MLPKILRNFNVIVDGRGYAGRIEELTLPKLTLKMEEFRAGGMDLPIAVDMGMEKLEAELTFADYDPELFTLFGLTDGAVVGLTLRGGLQGVNGTEAVEIILRGQLKELDMGHWKPADRMHLKSSIALRYYKLSIDHRELIEIDAENMVRKINGVDQLATVRQALGI